jgi:hypothetical protein
MSRRNPRGSSAAKRRQKARSRSNARREYIPVAVRFYSAAYELGQQAARTINKLIRERMAAEAL